MYRRLLFLREAEHITQTNLAAILNCSQRVYSNYERGDLDIPTEILVKLADHYKTSVDYLLDRTDVRKPYPKSNS